jgi:hypothetical protein
MNFEKRKEIPRKKAWLSFGGPSAEGEYHLHLEDCSTDKNHIPTEVSKAIQTELGNEWDVSNRGTRLEIIYKNFERDDEKIYNAVQKVLGNKYKIEKP